MKWLGKFLKELFIDGLSGTGLQQLNKRKNATGRIKPVFFCQIFLNYMLYVLYVCGIIGMEDTGL